MTTLAQITTNLANAWNTFTHSKRQIALTILLQFIFIAILAWASIEILPRIPESALQMGEILTAQSQSIQPEEAYKLEEMLSQNPQFMEALEQTIKSLLLLLSIIIASYILFIMPCWFLAHQSVKKTKISVLFKLFGLGILWAFVLGIMFVIYSVASGSTQTILPLSSSGVATAVMVVLIVLVKYLAIGSFAAADQKFKNMFSMCIKNAKTFIPALLINALLIFVAGSFGVLWWFDSPTTALVLFLVLLFPVLAFTRIHLIHSWYKQKV